MADLKELKRRSKALDPSLRIGKNGLTENGLKEIMILLKKKRLVKIKLLKNCPDPIEDVIERSVNFCSCTLVDKIGLTFCIHK
ncbi:YhbY family RNA-binding protein [Candidatus Woesearchaeota archaeon]|nr:YhbY family RNA-binding protein [Candidatus Woesearchaeota archaeon]